MTQLPQAHSRQAGLAPVRSTNRKVAISTARHKGAGVMAIIISKDGCGHRNDIFCWFGWLSGGRGDGGIETMYFNGFRKCL